MLTINHCIYVGIAAGALVAFFLARELFSQRYSKGQGNIQSNDDEEEVPLLSSSEPIRQYAATGGV